MLMTNGSTTMVWARIRGSIPPWIPSRAKKMNHPTPSTIFGMTIGDSRKAWSASRPGNRPRTSASAAGTPVARASPVAATPMARLRRKARPKAGWSRRWAYQRSDRPGGGKIP